MKTSPAALAKVGDIVIVNDSIDVCDGRWIVVRALPKSKGNMCNGGKRSRLQILAKRKATPDWPEKPWWVEDVAVVEIGAG